MGQPLRTSRLTIARRSGPNLPRLAFLSAGGMLVSSFSNVLVYVMYLSKLRIGLARHRHH